MKKKQIFSIVVGILVVLFIIGLLNSRVETTSVYNTNTTPNKIIIRNPVIVRPLHRAPNPTIIVRNF